MARIVDDDVRGYVRDYDPDISLTPFIAMANVLTNRVAEKDTGNLLNTDELFQIEKCLAGHFYRTRDHGMSQEATENASGKYTEKFEMGLQGTREGQDALLFDETGYLRRIGEGVITAKVTWLGKVPSAQIDSVDRD